MYRLSSMAVFFCAVLARLNMFRVGANVDAFMRAGYLLFQSVNPLDTRPPLFDSKRQRIINLTTGGNS